MKRFFSFKTIFSIIAALGCIMGFNELFGSTSDQTTALAFAPMLIDPGFLRSALVRYQNENPNSVVSEHTLRTLVKVENGITTFELKLQKGTDVPKSIEQRLGENDAFVGIYAGCFLRKVVSNQFSLSRRSTYPNPAEFATDGADFISSHLNIIYNGFLQFKSGTLTNFDGIPMSEFLYISETQQGITTATTITAADSITAYAIANSSINKHAGYHQLAGMLQLSGRGDNTFEVRLPSESGTSPKIANTNANTDNYLEFELKGLIIKGAAAKYAR
jgi:hypothetical protein